MVTAVPGNYPRVTAYLAVEGAAEAIDFYAAVLGAVERLRIASPDGRVGHAELVVGDGLFMVADSAPEMGAPDPRTVGGTPVTMNVYVENADTTFAAAIARGATELRPVQDQFYGDRGGTFEDPWGHRWSVQTHIEDVSNDEMIRRAAEMFG